LNLAKKKGKEPKRQFTKHQITRLEQRKKRKRVLLIAGISVIAVVAGVIGSGWYTEQYQPTRTNEETATRILEDTEGPNEVTVPWILEDIEGPNEVAAPQALEDAGETNEVTGPKIIEAVSAREALTLIQDNQNNPDFVIIDAQATRKFDSGHIANAISIPNGPDFTDRLDKLDKNKIYLGYCREGCGKTSDTMKQLGFREVYEIEGGLQAWISQGFPIEE
jgi:rhodanese-related sulfurtransferase